MKFSLFPLRYLCMRQVWQRPILQHHQIQALLSLAGIHRDSETRQRIKGRGIALGVQGLLWQVLWQTGPRVSQRWSKERPVSILNNLRHPLVQEGWWGGREINLCVVKVVVVGGGGGHVGGGGIYLREYSIFLLVSSFLVIFEVVKLKLTFVSDFVADIFYYKNWYTLNFIFRHYLYGNYPYQQFGGGYFNSQPCSPTSNINPMQFI